MSAPDYICDSLKDNITLLCKYRKIFTQIRNENKHLKSQIFTMTNVLKIANDTIKQKNLLGNHSQTVIAKQTKIIEDSVNVKEDNNKLKEELKKLNETLQNLHKEIDKIRFDSANELKEALDLHEYEISLLHEQYQKQAQNKEEEFLETKCQLEKTITDLKQNIESLQTEKNIIIEVTVREYEDRLNRLTADLEESHAERKSLEERNIANMNLYTKRLECQEQNYITMLESVRKEVQHSRSKGYGKWQNHQQKLENLNQLPMTGAQALCINSKSRLQKSAITSEACNETCSKNDLPVNVSYYNQLQIPLPLQTHGQMPNSCYTSSATATNSNSNNGVICNNNSHNNNNIAREVYSYLRNNAMKSNNTSSNDNKVSDEDFQEKETDHCNNFITNNLNKDSSTTNKPPVPKRRKLFNPEVQENLI